MQALTPRGLWVFISLGLVRWRWGMEGLHETETDLEVVEIVYTAEEVRSGGQ